MRRRIGDFLPFVSTLLLLACTHAQPTEAIADAGLSPPRLVSAPSGLCGPCKVSSDCGATNLCLVPSDQPDAAFGFCGTDCARASCPKGFSCETIDDTNGKAAGVSCVPDVDCDASDAGTIDGGPAGIPGGTACSACSNDSDCVGINNLCLPTQDYEITPTGGFCSRDCNRDHVCAIGFSCLDAVDLLGSPIGKYCQTDKLCAIE